MPMAGTPGAQASSLYGQTDTQGGNLYGQSQAIAPTLSGLYNEEIANPQGFGATTLAQMLTQSGESTAGGIGAAKETAMNLGARTGNTSAIPSIISSADKAGIQQSDNAANSLAIQNTMQKLNQQQEGAKGLSSLYGEDLSGGLQAENLADSALKTRISANQQSQGQFDKLLGVGLGAATGGLTDVVGGLGNLDTTGGSSFGEQIQNFLTGFGGGQS